MEESFLNHQQPPLEMDCSLITSGDFTNLNFLTSEYTVIDQQNQRNNATLTMDSNYNGYTLNNVISDTKFLEDLAICDDVLLKDDNISKIDFTFHDSGASTLQNSEDFSMKSSSGLVGVSVGIGGILNETFVPRNDENCVNGTIIVSKENNVIENQALSNENNIVKNTTFVNENDNIVANATFVNENNVVQNETFVNENAVESNDTFGVVGVTNQTFINPGNVPIPDKEHTIVLHSENDSIPEIESDVELSTPENYKDKFALRRSLENITPIRNDIVDASPLQLAALESTPMTKTLPRANKINRQVFTPVKEDEIIEQCQLRINNRNETQILTEQERQSLANFEEFEKSISMLGTDGNEKEFDDILNSLGNTEGKLINEKMRQSLDNIKKRHSLMNLERQQEDLIKKSVEFSAFDSNRLNESMNRSMNSLSGSERLLNRRSRLFDGVQPQSESTTSSQEFKPPSPTPTEDDNKPADKNNRDRFKTIRIFRKPNDSTLNLPDADNEPTSSDTNTESTNPVINVDDTSKQDVNADEFKVPQQPAVQSRLAQPRRFLAQPRFYGQSRPGQFVQTLKSSSADDLLDRNSDSTQDNSDSEEHREKVTSPMGTKAKSFHNINASNAYAHGESSHGSSRASSLRPVSKMNGMTSRYGVNKTKDVEVS